MALTYQQIKARLDSARTIALPLDEVYSTAPLGRKIAQEWIRFLFPWRRRSPLLGYYLMYGDGVEEIFTLDAMTCRVALLDSWIDKARTEFLENHVSFFLRCEVIPSGKRRKHWPKRNMSNAQIQEATRRHKESMFRREFTLRDANSGLRVAMTAEFEPMLKGKISRIAVDFEHDVGFAAGRPTSFVLYDIDHSTPSAHAYPISAAEARSEVIVTLSKFDLIYNLRVGGDEAHSPQYHWPNEW